MNLESWTNQTIPDCYERVAGLFAERPGVVSGGVQASHGSLAEAARNLAGVLAVQGVSPGDRVVLLLPDDIPVIVGWLGTLRSGAVCVPLSASHPEGRLRAVITDADPMVVVTDSSLLELAGRVCGSVPILNLDELPAVNPDDWIQPALAPSSHAYIMYTSGSTGKPKGVIQTHRNLLKNVRVLSELMGITAQDRMAGMAAFSMGQGVATLFTSLLNGATLYPYAIRQAGVGPLVQWLNEQQISVYTSSVTVFRQFARSIPAGTAFPCLRIIRLGTEELRIADVKLFQERLPRGCTLLNCLGSTETLNYARFRINHDTVIAGDAVPVGHPPEGTTLSLVRPDGSACQETEQGEIIVRGKYLSPGYWHDAELTAQRFQGTDEHRFYRTGDLGRRLPDGTIEFVGRADHLVKIRGNRIELGDVENTLLNHPEITQAAAVVRQNQHAEAELVAHVATQLSKAAVREFLRDRLPEFMMPSVIVRMDSLPLTPSGKIDREALRAGKLQDRDAEEHTKVLPRNEWETGIARCWARVLECGTPGVHDDFRSLGGDSLKALRLFAEIQASLNIAFQAKEVMENFTVACMAEIAEARCRQAPLSAAMERHPAWNFLVPIRTGGDEEPVVIIPGGWGGDNEILLLAGMAGSLNTSRDLYAVRSRAMDASWTRAGTLREHAAAVLEELQQIITGGKWLLIGECVAGAVAMEIACQAQARGLAPEAVVLLDPFTPPRQSILARALGHPNKVPQSALSGSNPPQIRDYYHLVKSSTPGRIHGDLHVILASDAKEPLHAPQYWGRLVRGQVHLHEVRGTHQSYLRSDVAETSAVLNAILFDSTDPPAQPAKPGR